MMKLFEKSCGFSLIELMVVVAIVGVLGAIAYPAYLDSVRKSNRSEAMSELNDAIQRFQRCYTVYGTFKPTTPTNACPIYQQLKNGGSYITNGRGFYQIMLATGADAITDASVKVVATAIKAPQTTDTKIGPCTDLKLNQNGVREPTRCW